MSDERFCGAPEFCDCARHSLANAGGPQVESMAAYVVRPPRGSDVNVQVIIGTHTEAERERPVGGTLEGPFDFRIMIKP